MFATAILVRWRTV